MVKMFLIGFVIWSCLLQPAPAEPEVVPNRQTNLEDIERDNLKSERHLAYEKRANVHQQLRASSSQGNNHYSIQIEHHPGGGASSHAGINYVTPIPSGQSALAYPKEYVPQYQQKVPQVHEEHSTYTVPSRQSLLQPIIGGSAPASSFLTPQPQYVYVQAQPPQQTHQYSNHNLPQSLLHILPQNQQAYIMIPSSYYQSPHSAQQYEAYVNDPDNHVESYSHGETGNSSPEQPPSGPTAPEAPLKSPEVVYATPSSTPAPFRQQSPSAEFSIVKSVEPQMYFSHDNHLQPSSGVQYSHTPAKPANLIHHETQTTYPSLTNPNNGILNYFGVQHKAPTSLLDSYVPSGLQLSAAKPFPYPTKSLQPYQPQHQQHHHHQYHPQHHHQHFQQPQLYFQPSHQQSFQQSYQQPHQQLHQHSHQPSYQPAYQVSHASYPVYATHAPAQSQIQAGSAYNTIAYSVPLTHTKTLSQYKRSPALGTVAGIKYSTPRAVSPASPFPGAITKLQPAAKLT